MVPVNFIWVPLVDPRLHLCDAIAQSTPESESRRAGVSGKGQCNDALQFTSSFCVHIMSMRIV